MSLALPLTGSEVVALTIVGWPDDFREARQQREFLRALKSCSEKMRAALRGSSVED